jgi:molecular chaperone DnaJ
VITLKRKGLPNLRTGNRGQQFVQVFVEIPRKLTQRQRDLLKQYAETEEDLNGVDGEAHTERKSFFEKLKDYFTPAKR